MIRVFVDPIPKLSIAMRRVAHALKVTAPPWVRIADDVSQADVQVLHSVALNVRRHLRATRYATIMYGLDYQQDPKGSGANVPIVVPAGMNPWEAVWRESLVVWSYYDLTGRFGWSEKPGDGRPLFYDAPLGVDGDTFIASHGSRDVGVVTSGHVSGPQAEAIEEVAIAAHRAAMTTVNVGPNRVGGMTSHVPGWSAVTDVTDTALAALYGKALWVAGLRHGEGFELPAIEGLVCGARPVVFDRPCYRRWFDGHAVFVPDTSGPALIEALAGVFDKDPKGVTDAERATILDRFNWITIAKGFWTALEQACQTTDLAPLVRVPDVPARTLEPVRVRSKRKLIWVGDSPTTDWTGFGRATKHVLSALAEQFDVTVLGTTHDGFPYDREKIPFDVYPITKPFPELVTEVRPDVVVLQHDPWQVQQWLRHAGSVPVVATMPIDGLNCKTDYLNGLAMAIWWTKFADAEARRGGYLGPSRVIPLGVDLATYQPFDTAESRRAMGLPAELMNAFIVGVVARNQPRKRLDLTVRHFAEWVHTRGVQDAYLYVQTAPTGEGAFDVADLMRYEKLANRVILFEPKVRRVVPESMMARIYSAMDVYFTTTQGEGFGLPVLEAMACGVPVVAPNWSALGDWARGAAHLVETADIAGTINGGPGTMSQVKIAVLGAVPDRRANVEALDRLYTDHAYYEDRRTAGLELAMRPEFRWDHIGRQVLAAVEEALSGGPRQVTEARELS